MNMTCEEENNKKNIQKALEWFTPQVIERTSLNVCLNQDNMPNEIAIRSKLIHYNIMRMSASHIVCKPTTFLNKLPREMVEHIKSYFHFVNVMLLKCEQFLNRKGRESKR